MSAPLMPQARREAAPRMRLAARAAAAAARPICLLPPTVISMILGFVCRGTSPAGADEVSDWRNAVNVVNRRCAGKGCLQRSVAVMLLGGLVRRTPVWCTGFQMAPFLAHAWVEVDGVPVDEPEQVAGYYKAIEVRPRWRGRDD
ncbi:lasso peptide biosynthesis B2 protein [uncultured Propionibacterium sp.]|uniref:lasso peptide biosynthesis B2 protein n=1 Tax=uncultured Propionibacterium sp. TaxID=218066 RepID=UPI00292FD412|nr:lasso peptide biosynthesis B2 protein [uncultured Propionibacterium sp.]